jgi:NitT/TauT family transport system substrate-binding protein
MFSQGAMNRIKALLIVALTTFFSVPALVVSAPAETIKVGVMKLLAFPSTPIAIDRGYFKAQGLDTQMVYFDSAEPMAVAMASGDIDFGVAGVGAAFYTLAGQGQIRVIASSAMEHRGGFYNLVILASNKAYADGLTTPHDMLGHSIGVAQLGTSLNYTIGLIAAKDQVPFNTLTIRPLQSIPNIISALVGNQIDSAVLPGTPTFPLIDNGKVKLLGWVGDIVPNWMGAVAFTSKKHADRDGDLVKRFMIAYRKASHDYHDAFATADDKRQDGPDAPAMLDLLSKFTGIPTPLIDRAVPYVDSEGRVVMSDLAAQIAWYRAQNMMKADVKPADFVDMRYAIAMPEGK